MLIGVGLIDFSSSDFISKTLDLTLGDSQNEALLAVEPLRKSLFKARFKYVDIKI